MKTAVVGSLMLGDLFIVLTQVDRRLFVNEKWIRNKKQLFSSRNGRVWRPNPLHFTEWFGDQTPTKFI